MSFTRKYFRVTRMKKSQRFSTLAEIAKSKEQAAAIELGTLNRVHAENITKLESLKQFRLEYIEKFKSEGQAGMGVNTMQTYKNFIEGIETAIREQQVHIIESEQQCEQSKRSWQQVHSKTEIMNSTVKHYKKKEASDESHREQKENDDRPYRKRVIPE